MTSPSSPVIRPLVIHYREQFPVMSETFIRETVAGHQRYDPLVVTHLAGQPPGDVAASTRVLDGGMPTGLSRWSSAVRIRRRARLLHAAVTETTPSIIHAHFGEESVVAAAVSAKSGIPFVSAFYGYDATELAGHSAWRRRFRRLFLQVSAVLAEGSHMAARLVELGAPSERVLVHPIPVRIELFPFDPPVAPSGDEPLVFLQACRFAEKKGVDATIAAFARIAQEVPSAVLWLLGNGPEEARLRRLAADTGLGERITFLAARPHQEYANVLRQAHVFVHPSRTARNGDGEGGAPTALLEAQALGLPIVATMHADIPEVVDRDAALLAPVDDVPAIAALMLRMVQNPQEWSERAAAGRRQVVERHDPRRLAARLEDIYDRVRS